MEARPLEWSPKPSQCRRVCLVRLASVRRPQAPGGAKQDKRADEYGRLWVLLGGGAALSLAPGFEDPSQGTPGTLKKL